MSTYTQLKSDVASFLARDDLTSDIDTFIDLAEDKIRRAVRVAEMRKSAIVDATTDSPDDAVVFDTAGGYLEPISLSTEDGATKDTYTYVSPNQFDEIVASNSQQRVFSSGAYGAIPSRKYNGVMNASKAGASGISDSAYVTVALMFKTGLDSYVQSLFSIDGATFRIAIELGGQLEFFGRNAAGGTVLSTKTTTVLADNTWYSVLFSADVENGTAACWLNGSDETLVTATLDTLDTFGFSSTGQTTDTNYMCGYYTDASGGFEGFAGTLVLMGIKTGVYTPVTGVNADVERARFFDANYNPVFGGDQGQRAFGSAAEIWVPDGDVGNNRGTITGFERNMPFPEGDTSDRAEPDDRPVFNINPTLSSDEVRLRYYEAFPRLSSTVEDHWLIRNNYDLYLYGTLAEAYDFLQNGPQEEKYRGKMQGVIESLNGSNLRKLRGAGPKIRRNVGRVTP